MNIFSLTYILWILSEVFLNRFVRSGKLDKKAADRKTELYLWITIISSITIGVLISQNFSFPIFFPDRLRIIGIIVILIGIIIRFVAIKQLGRFFTVDVTIRKDHELMQSGFYKYLRHPSYTGSLISFLGCGLSFNNWAGLAIVFIPTLFAFIHRINIEEKVLTEQFGNQYTDYIKKSKRLLPFIY
jgi:protein-S-isoprenylcysteine O-methyltransferase Ste14